MWEEALMMWYVEYDLPNGAGVGRTPVCMQKEDATEADALELYNSVNTDPKRVGVRAVSAIEADYGYSGRSIEKFGGKDCEIQREKDPRASLLFMVE